MHPADVIQVAFRIIVICRVTQIIQCCVQFLLRLELSGTNSNVCSTRRSRRSNVIWIAYRLDAKRSCKKFRRKNII